MRSAVDDQTKAIISRHVTLFFTHNLSENDSGKKALFTAFVYSNWAGAHGANDLHDHW